jgi:hypothetical protein
MLPLLAPAAVGLGKLGVGLLGGTAVAGTGTALLNAIPTFKETFGQTNKAQAKNEQYNRTALPGEKIDRDGLEQFMDFFTGRDAGEIERLALERDNARIKSNVAESYNLEKIQKNIKDLQLSQALLPTLKDNQTQLSYTNKLDRAKAVIRDATLAQVRYPGINLTGLDETGLAKAIGQKDREKELKLEKEEKARYGDTRKDKSDAMILALMNQQAGNRRADNQFNLQMSQQDYNNRVLEQTDRRNSRKDQREMLMTIMLGLDNIGKNFA